MKNNMIEKVKAILQTEREAINARQLNEDIDIAGDDVDAIQGKMIAHVQSQLSSRDAQKLKGIDAVFVKIEDGTFGACEECGDEIPEKRILINPLFDNCVVCAEKLEAQTKRNRLM